MSYSMGIGGDNFNYTYNVSGMWYACYPEKGIREHYGKTGREAVPVLIKLWEYMEDNKEELEEMDPKNGWGSYHGAKAFVVDLIAASLRNPYSIWDGD